MFYYFFFSHFGFPLKEIRKNFFRPTLVFFIAIFRFFYVLNRAILPLFLVFFAFFSKTCRVMRSKK